MLGLWSPGLNRPPLDQTHYPFTLRNKPRDDDGNSGVTVLHPDLPYEVYGVSGATKLKMPAVAIDTKAERTICGIFFAELVPVVYYTLLVVFDNDVSAALAVPKAAVNIALEPYRTTCVQLVLFGVARHCNDAKEPFKTRNKTKCFSTRVSSTSSVV